MNRRLYLDSNIYLKAHVEDYGPAVTLLEAATDGAVTVVASDQLVDEIYWLFRKLFDRRQASWMRASLLALPSLRIVDKHEWRRAKPTVAALVRDRSDLPHYAAAWTAGAEFMVSINRRSIKAAMFELVPLAGPIPIAEALAGKRPWPSREELLAEWRRWAQQSRRGPGLEGRER